MTPKPYRRKTSPSPEQPTFPRGKTLDLTQARAAAEGLAAYLSALYSKACTVNPVAALVLLPLIEQTRGTGHKLGQLAAALEV